MIADFSTNIFSIALYQPEIPANTGNIIRLAACLNAQLHLVHPLGFNFEDRHLKRAGLDYHDLAHITHHENENSFLEYIQTNKIRLIGLSTKSSVPLWSFEAVQKDCYLFGPETRGLPEHIRACTAANLRIPMHPSARSLNLSNSVAIVGYEMLRQLSLKI